MAERPNASALKAEGFTPRGFKSLSFRQVFSGLTRCGDQPNTATFAGLDRTTQTRLRRGSCFCSNSERRPSPRMSDRWSHLFEVPVPPCNGPPEVRPCRQHLQRHESDRSDQQADERSATTSDQRPEPDACSEASDDHDEAKEEPAGRPHHVTPGPPQIVTHGQERPRTDVDVTAEPSDDPSAIRDVTRG